MKKIATKDIDKIAEGILNDLNIDIPPISIEYIAKKKGIQIKPFDFGDGVSGALVIDNEKVVIGYNPFESPVRRRFTIAHELGHFMLHRQHSNLWVDKEKVLYRNQNSATGEFQIERDANYFAAAILMPAFMVFNEVSKLGNDFIDEKSIKKLAEIFDVSQQAMTIRLTKLNLFW